MEAESPESGDGYESGSEEGGDIAERGGEDREPGLPHDLSDLVLDEKTRVSIGSRGRFDDKMTGPGHQVRPSD